MKIKLEMRLRPGRNTDTRVDARAAGVRLPSWDFN
jgi:hypothetical protein